MIRSTRSLLAGVTIAATAATLAVQPVPAAPPATPRRPVPDTYHGQAVIDPYRWLEDGDAPEVAAWSDAQNADARRYLDRLPDAAPLRRAITAILSAKTVRYGRVTSAGNRLFALQWQPPRQQPLLVMLRSADTPTGERVVVDPNGIDPSGRTSIDWFVPSSDGTRLAVSLSQRGTESGDVHLFDTETGRPIGAVVRRVNGGTAGGDVAWAADGSGFYYTRYPRRGERSDKDLNFYQQVFFHRLGTSPETDRYELGKGFPRIAEIQLATDPRSARLLATVQLGDGGRFAHYLREPGGRWRRLSQFGDGVLQATFDVDDSLLIVSRAGAPHGKLLRLASEQLDWGQARTVIPAGDATIVTDFWGPPTVVPVGSRIYVLYQQGGPTRLRVFNRQGKPMTAPRQRPISSVGAPIDLGHDAILFRHESYVDPPGYDRYEPAAGTTVPTALSTGGPVDFAGVTVRREFARSRDGTRVPLNLLLPAGAAPGHPRPCVVTGYGGYAVSLVPRYRPVREVLLGQGVLLVVANLRGGGEYGETWHQQGNLTRKQNVFDDFHAVLEHLVTRGYTTPDKLAIIGGSNGGLLMGATLTQHPGAIRAVVSRVGIYDMLRVEQSPNGQFNIPEFGTVEDPDQFRALRAYSPYHHVRNGVAYPATLLLTGANDPRVDPMQSRKMAAALQAANTSGQPILLRTNRETGHGGGTPLAARIDETVDIDAFLLDRLGVAFRWPPAGEPDERNAGAE